MTIVPAYPLAGRLVCGWCGQPMRTGRTRLSGTRVYGCPVGCRRRLALPAYRVEQAVHQAVVFRLPQLTRRVCVDDNGRTVPTVLARVTVGANATDLRLSWHAAPSIQPSRQPT